jgi:hypothetical protein
LFLLWHLYVISNCHWKSFTNQHFKTWSSTWSGSWIRIWSTLRNLTNCTSSLKKMLFIELNWICPVSYKPVAFRCRWLERNWGHCEEWKKLEWKSSKVDFGCESILQRRRVNWKRRRGRGRRRRIEEKCWNTEKTQFGKMIRCVEWKSELQSK